MGKDLRKSILEAEDIGEEIVDVPEWGVKLKIKGMTGKERARFLKSTSDPATGDVAFEKFYSQLLISTAFDPEDDSKVFEVADADFINAKSGAVIERVAQVAQKLSGLGGTELEEAKGNSESSLSDGST